MRKETGNKKTETVHQRWIIRSRQNGTKCEGIKILITQTKHQPRTHAENEISCCAFRPSQIAVGLGNTYFKPRITEVKHTRTETGDDCVIIA